MCGIAGILYKGSNADQDVGEALISMLDGCQHRGPDSTGFALYHEPKDNQLRLRFFVGAGNEATAAISEIKEKLQEFQAEVLGEESVGTTYKVIVKFSGDVQRFAYAMEHAAKVISIGNSLDIVKDVGSAHDVDDTYGVDTFRGSHGIGHVRLATESEVKPEAAHPFWATGFSDVAIVHNGQITNYWKMRRRL
ncbi:MAG: Amidophosphoribosyltransferase, partial [Alphaproteobacteria bacterium MarineAlpha3_Bin4]